MGQLGKHIRLANQDLDQVDISSNKLNARFKQIEQVELSEHETPSLMSEDEISR